MLSDEGPPLRRLVILANYAAPYSGTFIAMICAVAREARERGWPAEIILCSEARGRSWLTEIARDDIQYRFAPDLPLAQLRQWLTEHVLGNDATVLHTHFTKFDVAAALAAKKHRGVTVFWHIHSNARLAFHVRLRNIVKYAYIGRLVERIFCVAPDIARDVRGRGGSKSRVRYVPNAIDTSRFSETAPSDRVEARRRLGVPMGARILLHFGWDWERKGGDMFVRTIAVLTKYGTPVFGVTVGGGQRARDAVAAQGLEESIQILEPRDDVTELYAAADVFLAPSQAEGMPFAVVEALCTGLAVVGSNIPGQVAIAEGIDACRLTNLNADCLARAVCKTLSRNVDVAAAEGTAARAEVVRRFDLRPWAKRMVDYYLEAEKWQPLHL